MVGVSLCRGVVLGAAPALWRVPQGGGLEHGGGDVCLYRVGGLDGGMGMDVFYTDEVTLKSLLRAEAGLVVVDGGIVRAKRNLPVFRPARFGRRVTVEEMMEEDAGLPWRYGVCLLAGLAVMVWVRHKETEGGR